MSKVGEKVKDFFDEHGEAIAIGLMVAGAALIFAAGTYAIGVLNGFSGGVTFTQKYFQPQIPGQNVVTQPPVQ